MKQYLVGHRGAMGLAPENTLKAFKTGCLNGADVVECDIHHSRDNKLVVFHDNTLDRTTNGSGWLRDYSLSELKRFDAGDGEKIPELAEVIDLVSKYQKRLIIEIKGESEASAKKTLKLLVKFLETNKFKKNVIIHSFWHEVIKESKKLMPDVLAAAIFMVGLPVKKMLKLILDAKADGASIAYDYISKDLVSLAKKNELFIDAWALDDKAAFDSMRNLGVNGLITNFPVKLSCKL